MDPIVQTVIEVTLVYADESTWFAGSFPSLEAANKWIDEEKSRPYWVETTTVQVVDKTPI
jgi:hypothetical protein